ncbi:MAG: hypothetical protein O3C54_04450 [Proteobacteria bacterium]|nr:hypothetical protein [Pseudomonadota bacterium]
MENTPELNEAIGTLSRTADIMDSFSLKIVDASKQIEDSRKGISTEVALLRSCNEEISNTIENSFLQTADTLSDKTANLLRPVIHKETEQLHSIISALKKDQSDFLNILRNENSKQKKRLSKLGLGLCFSFCLGSIASGFGLWYFFPQTSIVKIDLTSDQRKQMEHGALLQFAMPKLPKKEQDKLWSLMGDSWKEYYEKMFNVKFPRKQ